MLFFFSLSSRETINRLLAFPLDTNIVWKSHDDSIAQRSAIDQARHEKSTTTGSTPTGHLGTERRRNTGHDDSDKVKGVTLS
jgi:translation initiation factor 4E